MSETGHSGINRAFTWLKKVLQITEKTVVPDSVLPNVRPTMDLFGWDRLSEEIQTSTDSAAATATVSGPTTPEGVLRYVIYAHVEQQETTAVDLTCWLDMQVVLGGFRIAINVPTLIPGGLGPERTALGLTRPVCLRPGERINGRCNPATGVGVSLQVKMVFIDLPIGEYIPPR